MQIEYYTLTETAEKLRVKPATLYNWIKDKKITCYKNGRKYLFTDKDILQKLNKNRINNNDNK